MQKYAYKLCNQANCMSGPGPGEGQGQALNYCSTIDNLAAQQKRFKNQHRLMD